MEKLALMIQENVSSGEWHSMNISSLFFADDYLLLVKASWNQVKLVKDTLDKFYLALGLKINVQKSRFLASKNVPYRMFSKFSSIIHFGYTTNLGKYLGFPFFTGRVKESDFSFIMDKISGRLQGRKNKMLNCVGQVS